MAEAAPQQQHPLREALNGLPPWHVVYDQTQRWLKAGMFEAMVQDLRALSSYSNPKRACPAPARSLPT